MAEFNLFGNANKGDIRVAYISSERGFIDNVTVCEANDYAKLNPGTQFIFRTREFTKYMNINGVNKLTPDDLSPQKDCEGIQMTKECGPAQAHFAGGGGVGIKGNPVIGQDGAVLAIDLVSGGFGYQVAPNVVVKDNCGIGAGGNFVAELGEIAERFEYYDLEEDFEDYEICEGATDTGVFGQRYGINGEDLGVWEPRLYANFEKDPIALQIKKYQDLLAQGTNPFWTTRKEAPLQVTGERGTTRKVFNVDHSAWSPFMNKYAISPKPKSNASGSDFAGIPYSFVWEEDFPLDGEYIFRGARDNKAKLFLDGSFISDLDNFKGAINPIKKTIKKGVHQIRVDLLNVPIKEKIIVDRDLADGDSEIKPIIYKNLHGANNPIKVSTDRKIIRLKDGHGGDTNGQLSIKSGDLRFSSDGKNLIGPGSSTIEFWWKDRGSAGFAVDSIKVAGKTWTRSGRSGTKSHVVTINPPPVQEKKSTSSQENDIHTVFNTVDFIDKANRPLWRTNVYSRGGFINENGICPFDTSVSLEDNPYAGTHTIVWRNVQFPIDGNYDIGVQVDDNVRLIIEGKGKREEIKKVGFAGDTDKSTGKSTYIRNFLKGNYTITAELEQKPGGRYSFDTSIVDGAPLASNTLDIHYSGLHSVNNPITVTDGGKTIALRDGHGNDTNASLRITSGNAIFSSDGRKIEGSGDATVVLSWKDKRSAGRAVNSIRIGSTTWTRRGTRGSQTHTLPVGDGVKGINPMALAINIESLSVEKEVISAKSWNENPMGISLSIDAPDPPIPQEKIPEAPGRCPRNPMWSTRHPNGKEKWYPVRFDGWSPFLNRYAMSPVAPRSEEDTDAGGTVYTNSWDQDIPYNGWYKIKGEVDDIGRVYINGEKKLDLSRRKDKIRGEEKLFLSKGTAEIKVEVENYESATFKTIDNKIFNTADWAVRHGIPGSSVGLDIIYKRLGYRNNPIHVTDGGKTIKLEQAAPGRGHHHCWVMTITSGNAVFSGDGKKLEGEGSVTINVKYASQAGKSHEYAVDSVTIGDKKWIRPEPRRSQGKVRTMARLDQTHVIDIPVDKAVNIKGLSGGTAKDGVTYQGPELASYIKNDLGPSLTPKWDITGDKILDEEGYRENFMGKEWTSTWENVYFPEDGQYTLQCLVDDTLSIKIDGSEVAKAVLNEQVATGPSFNRAEYLKYGGTSVKTITFNATKGRRTISATYTNIPGDSGSTFHTNPVYFAFKITKRMRVQTTKSKSWTENPIGISAVLVPPPCPKRISGKGTVSRVIVDDPGNGFPQPKGPGYPVGLGLSAINIKDAGINYDCAKDKVVITPNNGAKLSLCGCDNFGRISKVCVDEPGLFTSWPKITIESDTGVNFEATPVFDVIRDPIAPPEKLVQVTDLVGVKQTGYYQGRPYYGAVFYKDNIRYAGWYETPGQLVQIYDTMQESIDAEVTTPPSAILRQGSDVSSNDPKLNIPGTPDNLT